MVSQVAIDVRKILLGPYFSRQIRPDAEIELVGTAQLQPKRVIGEVLLNKHRDLIEDGRLETNRPVVEQLTRLVALRCPPRRRIIAVGAVFQAPAVTIGIHEPALRLPPEKT